MFGGVPVSYTHLDVYKRQSRALISETYAQGATNQQIYNFSDNADATHPAKLQLYISCLLYTSKAEFGLDNEDADRLRASYKEQRNSLTLSDSYIAAEEG